MVIRYCKAQYGPTLKPSAYFDGERVAPADASPIRAEAKDFTVRSSWHEFQAYSPDSDSDFNILQPYYTVVESSSATAARRLHKALLAAPEALESVTWHGIYAWLDARGIKYKTRVAQWTSASLAPPHGIPERKGRQMKYTFTSGPHTTEEDHRTPRDAYDAARAWALTLPGGAPRIWVRIQCDDWRAPVEVLAKRAEKRAENEGKGEAK